MFRIAKRRVCLGGSTPPFRKRKRQTSPPPLSKLLEHFGLNFSLQRLNQTDSNVHLGPLPCLINAECGVQNAECRVQNCPQPADEHSTTPIQPKIRATCGGTPPQSLCEICGCTDSSLHHSVEHPHFSPSFLKQRKQILRNVQTARGGRRVMPMSSANPSLPPRGRWHGVSRDGRSLRDLRNAVVLFQVQNLP